MENMQPVADYLLAKAAEFRAGRLRSVALGLVYDVAYCDAAAITLEALAIRAANKGWVEPKEETCETAAQDS